MEEPGSRSSSFESHQPSLDSARAPAAIDGGAATFDISFAVTTLVVVTTAVAAVLTSHHVPGAEWLEAAGASASACCGAYLLGALGAGDGPEERRRAAGWMAFAGLALGGLLVLEFMREFFTA